jgi:hypothetical protein
LSTILPGRPEGAIQSCPNCDIGWLVQDDAPVVGREGMNGYHCESSAGGCGFSIVSPAYTPPGQRGPLTPPRHAERRQPMGGPVAPRARPGVASGGSVWQQGENIGERAWVWFDDFRYDHSKDYWIGGGPEQGIGHPVLNIDPAVGLKATVAGDYHDWYMGSYQLGFQPLSVHDLGDVRVTWDVRWRALGTGYLGCYFPGPWNPTGAWDFMDRWIGVWSAGSDQAPGTNQRAEMDASDPNGNNVGYWNQDFAAAVDDHIILIAESRSQSVRIQIIQNDNPLIDVTENFPDRRANNGVQLDGMAGVDLRSIKVEAI